MTSRQKHLKLSHTFFSLRRAIIVGGQLATSTMYILCHPNYHKKSEGLRSAKKRWFFEHRLSFSTFFLVFFFVFFPVNPLQFLLSESPRIKVPLIKASLSFWICGEMPGCPQSEKTSMGTARLVASDALILYLFPIPPLWRIIVSVS